MLSSLVYLWSRDGAHEYGSGCLHVASTPRNQHNADTNDHQPDPAHWWN
jgi:hypothetical protein